VKSHSSIEISWSLYQHDTMVANIEEPNRMMDLMLDMNEDSILKFRTINLFERINPHLISIAKHHGKSKLS
jgi:hypothetical protein